MEFQLSYFKSWKMMLWKCCTQYASSHRTETGQFSLQSQRNTMAKNAQTTAQLHSSHILAKWCSKFSKPGFNSMWTMKFQMFKLYLEKAEEPEIKLPTSVRVSKSKRVPENIYFCFIDYAKAFDLCGSSQTVENSQRDGNTRPSDLPLEKSVCRSGSNS